MDPHHRSCAVVADGVSSVGHLEIQREGNGGEGARGLLDLEVSAVRAEVSSTATHVADSHWHGHPETRPSSPLHKLDEGLVHSE